MYRKITAFTLIEVLVVVAIIGIMAAMITTAVRGVTTTANIARTRSIIATVDSVIQDQYESYKNRPLPVSIPDFSAPGQSRTDRLAANTTSTHAVVDFEILPAESARIRLNMLRDLQRMEMPDRVADVREPGATGLAALNEPAAIRGSASRVVEVVDPMDPDFGNIFRSNVKSERVQLPISWYGSASTSDAKDVPSRLATYFERSSPAWTVENQGAECLYLIMSTSFVAGAPAIELIPTSYIGDTDGDGMLEILDGWKRPLGFIRWPVGFADPNLSIDTSIPDDFDLMRTDFGFLSDPAVPAFANVEEPWSMRPLIVSAGVDGEFGISFDAVNDGGSVTNFTYRPGANAMTWPVNDSSMGSVASGERGGRSAPYIFVDPYLRQFRLANASGLVPGSPLTGSNASDARAQDEARSDNLTNYQGASFE